MDFAFGIFQIIEYIDSQYLKDMQDFNFHWKYVDAIGMLLRLLLGCYWDAIGMLLNLLGKEC